MLQLIKKTPKNMPPPQTNQPTQKCHLGSWEGINPKYIFKVGQEKIL